MPQFCLIFVQETNKDLMMISNNDKSNSNNHSNNSSATNEYVMNIYFLSKSPVHKRAFFENPS